MSEIESDSIFSTLNLPFAMQDRVGLNVKKAERLAQLGGIRSVILKNDPNGETTKVERQIVGMNPDGSALSGASKVSYAPTSFSELDQDKIPHHAARWGDLSIMFNTQEMKHRLLHMNQTVTKGTTWARALDEAVRRELLKAGNHQLLSLQLVDKLGIYFVCGTDLATTLCRPEPSTPLSFAFNFGHGLLMAGVAWSVLTRIKYGSERRGGR